MGHSNGIIKAPLNTEDVSSVLGVASHDVGYLCGNAHGQINRWSKYKPVEIEDDVSIIIADKNATIGLTGANLPQGLLTGYTNVPAYFGKVYAETRRVSGTPIGLLHALGMTIPYLRGLSVGTSSYNENTATVMKELINVTNAADLNWQYYNVVGPTYPYRLTDFEGYSHNAGCPVSYDARKVYNGEYPRFSCMRNPEDYNTQIDLAELGKLFKGFKIYVAYFAKSKGTFYELLEIGNLNDNVDETVISTKLINDTLDMEAYFFAGSSANSIFIALPSSLSDPNPFPFQAFKYNNPATNPFNKLEFKDFGFALSRTASFFESFNNVNEGIYSALFSPQGYMCIRVKVSNLINATVQINVGSLTLTMGGRNLTRNIYKGSTLQSSYLSFAAKETAYIYFDIMGLFDGMGVSKASSYSVALSSPADHRIYEDIEIRYDSSIENVLSIEAFYAAGQNNAPFYRYDTKSFYTSR